MVKKLGGHGLLINMVPSSDADAMGDERVVTESAVISQTVDGPKRVGHVKLVMIVQPAATY